MQRTSAALAIADRYVMHVGSARVSMIADHDQIARRENPDRDWEPESRKLWGEWCRGGGTVLDVGAYTGIYSIGAALLGCFAIGYEPMRSNYERCLRNAELNSVRISCFHAALSDHEGIVDLTFNPKVALTSGASIIGGKGHRASVVATKIDNRHPAVYEDLKAIKIDVERAEPLVLRGARETLKRFRPMLLVEALGMDERNAVMDAVEGYDLVDVVDERNLVLAPC